MLITLEIDVTGVCARSNPGEVYLDCVDNSATPGPHPMAAVSAAVGQAA